MLHQLINNVRVWRQDEKSWISAILALIRVSYLLATKKQKSPESKGGWHFSNSSHFKITLSLLVLTHIASFYSSFPIFSWSRIKIGHEKLSLGGKWKEIGHNKWDIFSKKEKVSTYYAKFLSCFSLHLSLRLNFWYFI